MIELIWYMFINVNSKCIQTHFKITLNNVNLLQQIINTALPLEEPAVGSSAASASSAKAAPALSKAASAAATANGYVYPCGAVNAAPPHARCTAIYSNFSIFM